MVFETVNGSILSNTDGDGRISFDLETYINTERQAEKQFSKSNSIHGKADSGQCFTQSRLGGVVNGVPPEVDGHSIWEREPDNIPRLNEITENRAVRLKTLGNAVVPAQAFPILKYISDIETGRCQEYCYFE